MKIYLSFILSVLIVKGTFAQNLYTLPDNFKGEKVDVFIAGLIKI